MAKKKPHPLRSVWAGMKRRCYSESCRFYWNYGGRGIYVCERWLLPRAGFLNFLQDMGPRPEGHTIDRIDNDGPYSPENCRWASKSQQQLNRRCVRKIAIDGVEYIASELAKSAGLKTDTVLKRAQNNLSLEEIISKRKNVYKPGLALGGIANGARQRAKTHCPHGHEYTPDNLVASKNGFRRCKTCHRTRAAEAKLFSRLI